jgi:hypothetical protein
MTITDIVANIDRRLAEARVELTHLQGARTALVNGAQRAAAPKPRKARRKPARPAYQVVPAGKLTASLSGSEGMSTGALATATQGDPAQILALLKEQERAGEVRRTGTRAATRWHVVTDEERIAARAAELAGRSRQKRARKN